MIGKQLDFLCEEPPEGSPKETQLLLNIISTLQIKASGFKKEAYIEMMNFITGKQFHQRGLFGYQINLILNAAILISTFIQDNVFRKDEISVNTPHTFHCIAVNPEIAKNIQKIANKFNTLSGQNINIGFIHYLTLVGVYPSQGQNNFRSKFLHFCDLVFSSNKRIFQFIFSASEYKKYDRTNILRDINNVGSCIIHNAWLNYKNQITDRIFTPELKEAFRAARNCMMNDLTNLYFQRAHYALLLDFYKANASLDSIQPMEIVKEIKR